MQEEAKKILAEMGLRVSYGKHVHEVDEFMSSSIEYRLKDLHDAIADSNVKAIFPVSGGTTANQLLNQIDYELIRKNPKILCGLSDFTALANAINLKTDLVTYYGPHFAIFGASNLMDYTIDYFRKCFFEDAPIQLSSSDLYSNSEWDKEKIVNEGYWLINKGEAEGRVVGGNFLTLNLLQGSEYMPDVSNAVLFLENKGGESVNDTQNQLQALLNQPNFKNVRGLVIGRFQREAKVSKDRLSKVIKSKKELQGIPVIANVDFGHTIPMVTIPIGGTVKLYADDEEVKIQIVNH